MKTDLNLNCCHPKFLFSFRARQTYTEDQSSCSDVLQAFYHLLLIEYISFQMRGTWCFSVGNYNNDTLQNIKITEKNKTIISKI